MTFTISVRATDIPLSPASRTRRVLDAAQRAGLRNALLLPQGRLRHLQGPVVSGEVRAFAGDALSAAERAEAPGAVLQRRGRAPTWRSRRARSSKADPFARKTSTARVFRLQAARRRRDAGAPALSGRRSACASRPGSIVNLILGQTAAPRLLDGQSAARERRRRSFTSGCAGRRVHDRTCSRS